MSQPIEILAPAGGMESIYPAVRMGADAVYLGAEQFSARAGAQNFSRQELKEAVEYCHIRNVRVYLAVNTLLRDPELKTALSLAEYAASLPVDGFIVQDVGFASLLREAAPKIRLHASTQMSVHTPAGAAALYDAGFSRVVLSRELSLEEIKEIHNASPIELEVFVHGALCMSVSGQCYFSAMLGSRSGNRGQCAQPCRLPFSVEGGTGYDLSLKDYSIVSRLKELEAAGVTSAKIEGRMKRPEYVAAATAVCRYAADGKKIPEELAQKLEAVFSRSGFTQGYLTGELGRGMFGIRQKEDVEAATSDVLKELRQLYKDEKQTIPLDFRVEIHKGRPAALHGKDSEGHSAMAQGPAPQRAETLAVTEARCLEQLQKTGGTPFFCRRLDAHIDSGLSLPVAELNQMRRAVVESLEKQRGQRKPMPFSTVAPPKGENHQASKKQKLRVWFEHDRVPDCMKGCDLVYVPLSTPPQRLEELLNQEVNLAVHMPRGMFGREDAIRRQLAQAEEIGVSHVWVGNLGALALAQETDLFIHGGFSLNIFNTASVEWCEDNGLSDVELSFELTAEQARRIGGRLPRGLIAYGRLPLMLTRNCPNRNGAGCSGCGEASSLKDRKGVSFPMICDHICTQILNSVPLEMEDRKSDFSGMDFTVLRFTVENSVESEEKFHAFHSGQAPKDGFTRGLYYRGVD